MKTYLMIGAALAVAAAAWLYDRSAQPPAPIAPLHTLEPGTAATDAAPVRDAAAPAAATETIDDGTEIVLGLRVRKDRNCTVELRDYVTPDGEMFVAYTCTPHATRPPHPYASYSDATLNVLAYGDAEAAALLGKRLIERDTGRSYELLLRAAALDNDYSHLTWLAEQAFGTLQVDGEPRVDNLKRHYELAILSQHLGDSPGLAGHLREQLERAGIGSEELAALDNRVAELLQRVRDIQQTVHGDVTAGGPSDA